MRYVLAIAVWLSASVAVASPLGLKIGMTKEQVLKARPCTMKPGPKRLACRDAKLDSLEQTMRNQVCNHCTLSPTAGDFCSESLARTCPLSRHALDVVRLLERLSATTH